MTAFHIFPAFLRAVADLFAPSSLKVLGKGIGLAFLLFLGLYFAVFRLVEWAVPDRLALPGLGETTWLDPVAAGGSVVLMMGLSVFLMAPVASAFIGLFLEDVADAVEDLHYPTLPPVAEKPLSQQIAEALKFFGVVLVANLVALALLPFLFFLMPVIFLALNGYLLSREYFQMVASRRMHPEDARALYRHNRGTVWLAGVLMAIPLSIPLVNLAVPVFGAAAFTHLFHAITGRRG